MTTTTTIDARAVARGFRPTIAAIREQLDHDRRLPDEFVQDMARAGLFRMAVPPDLGGLGTDFVTMLEVIEDLSYADGAVGWVVAIGAGTPAAVIAAAPPNVSREVYGRDPQVITCGTLGVPGGRATPVAGGYRVTGRWPFGSGGLHSAWFASACLIMEGGNPRMKENGKPDQQLALFPVEDVEIVDTWHVAGLRGTGSNDYAVHDVFVPKERIFDPLGSQQHPSPLYAARLFLLLLGAHALGIGRRAIDEFSELAGAKKQTRSDNLLCERAMVQVDVARAEALVGTARAYLMEVAHDLWSTVSTGQSLTDRQRAQGRLALTTSVRQSAEAVDLMYEAAGGTSIYERSPLERCFRDIHTATQHAMAAPPTYEMIGQLLLGVPTTTPFTL